MDKKIIMSEADILCLATNNEFVKVLPKVDSGVFPRLMDFEGFIPGATTPVILRSKTFELINDEYVVTFVTKDTWLQRRKELNKEIYKRNFIEKWYSTWDEYLKQVNEMVKTYEYEIACSVSAITHINLKITVRIYDQMYFVYSKKEKILETTSLEEAVIKYQRLYEGKDDEE